jgi:hypothetical protein
MHQISSKSLVLLIQLVDSKMESLEKILNETPEGTPGLADIEEMILYYSNVEMELEQVYRKAIEAETVSIPYEELTKYRQKQISDDAGKR